MNSKKVILYDGECNLCIRSVKFIHRHDKENTFTTIPVQSKEAGPFLIKYGIQKENPHSVILIDNHRLQEKSLAGIRILELLNGTWWMAKMIRLIPRGKADKLYDLIARHRFRLFGKKSAMDTK